MQFVSTRGGESITLEEAAFRGLASDGGLYLPASLPSFSPALTEPGSARSLGALGEEFLFPFFEGTCTRTELLSVINAAFTFDAPLRKLSSGMHILELFHGPTCAFKDFGARFMAQVLSSLALKRKKRLTILVATSGDTGGAVAAAFFKVPNIQVTILYPRGRISPLQELQLTTWGENVQALAVEGSFDDCQRMVKEAFSDRAVAERFSLTSANSINILRLLPQAVYYLRAIAQLPRGSSEPFFVVPSGNFGNVCAGLIAALANRSACRFLAATNANDTVPRYFSSGAYEPKTSLATISNAMDVGAPSNFERISTLFHGSREEIQQHLSSVSISDVETITTIKEVAKTDDYIVCPHTAVGIAAAKRSTTSLPTIVLATAHPAKFADILRARAQLEVPLPEPLRALTNRSPRFRPIEPRLEAVIGALR